MTKRKYIRVMCDYCSTGLWNDDGANVDVEQFNLSKETLAALKAWCHLFETNPDLTDPTNYDDDYEPNIAFWKAFSEQGLKVAIAIKRELPDYEIYYFDEFALMNSKSRSHRIFYEYPVR